MMQDASTVPGAIKLSNPMRVIVPIATFVIVMIMLGPPFLLTSWAKEDPAKMGIGISIMVLCTVWLLVSAWRAPFEARVETNGIILRRLLREHSYGLTQIRKWWFAIPDGKPTQNPPATNGVLYITFNDRTRFRAEVTAEEAAQLATILPAAIA